MTFPKIVGVVNLTPDSFSDGGTIVHSEESIEKLIGEGADVIELGAESTRPNAVAISVQEEWLRLEKCIDLASSICIKRGKLLSIDTRNAATAKLAIKHGANIINDVSGGKDKELLSIIAENPAVHYVLQHSLSIPVKIGEYVDCNDIIQYLIKWRDDKTLELNQLGIKSDRIIFDAGIGFGKSSAQSVEIIKKASQLKHAQIKTMLGHSRKSFIKELSGNIDAKSRDAESHVISAYLANEEIDYLRVHDVKGNLNAIKTWYGLCQNT